MPFSPTSIFYIKGSSELVAGEVKNEGKKMPLHIEE